MKKKVILPLCVALLLTGTTLTSCGGTSNSGTASTSQTSGDATVQRITINKSADTVVTIGSTISIDDYINLFDVNSQNVTPSDNNYTVTLTSGSDYASLEGHKLTVTSEGTISLRIQNGVQAEGVRANLTITGVSALKKRFYEETKDVVKNYTVEDLAEDSNGFIIDDNGFVGNQTGTVHNEQYIGFLQDSAKIGYLLGADSEVYYYTMSDRFGADLDVQQGPTGNELTDFYVGADFPISALTDTVTTKDDDGKEVLQLTSEATENFILYGLGYSLSNIKAAGYGIGNAEIDYQPVSYYDQDGKKVVTEAPVIFTYITSGTSTGLLSASILEVGDKVGIAAVENYISTTGQPDPITDPGIDTAIKAIASGKNYTIEETFGWFTATIDDETGEFGNYKEVSELPDGYVPENMAYLLPRFATPTVAKKKFTQDTVEETLVSGFGSVLTDPTQEDESKKGYVLYNKNSEDSTEVDVITNISKGDTSYSLLDEPTTTTSSLGGKDVFTYVSARSVADVEFDSVGIASVVVNEDTTNVTLNSGKYCSDFILGLIESSTYNQMNFLGDWSYPYFEAGCMADLTSEVTISFTKVDEAYTDFSVGVNLIWSANSGTYTVARWVFDITDIGTTGIGC